MKRYPGSGQRHGHQHGSARPGKWYIRNLRLDPHDTTKLFVSTYNDSQGRGGVWVITGVNTGSGKTPTRLTPTTIGQVNKIVFSDDGLRCYAACGNDGIWRGYAEHHGGNFTTWVDIGGTRISKQVEWTSVDCYTNGA